MGGADPDSKKVNDLTDKEDRFDITLKQSHLFDRPTAMSVRWYGYTELKPVFRHGLQSLQSGPQVQFKAFALLSIATLVAIPKHHCSTESISLQYRKHITGDYTPRFVIQSFSVQLTAWCYASVPGSKSLGVRS